MKDKEEKKDAVDNKPNKKVGKKRDARKNRPKKNDEKTKITGEKKPKGNGNKKKVNKKKRKDAVDNKPKKKNSRQKEPEDIKSIPEEVNGKKFWIVLLVDLGDYALYLNKSDGYFAGYEVHKIRVLNGEVKKIKGKTIEFNTKRTIARNSEFGKYAWHYPKLEFVYNYYPQFKRFGEEIRIKTDQNVARYNRKSTEKDRGL